MAGSTQKQESVAEAARFLTADPEVVRCPYPMFERLRREQPVAYVEDAGVWVVTRYQDILEAVRNPEVFSSVLPTGPHGGEKVRAMMTDLAEESEEYRSMVEAAAFRGRQPVLLRCDPPRHPQQRKLVNKAFTPRRVKQIEGTVEDICARLIDGVVDEGRMDLVADLAVPLPITVIAGALGVSDGDLPTFKRWSNGFALTIGNDDLTRDEVAEVVRTQSEFAEYFSDKIADRKANPQDDLISDVVHATIDGESLSHDELLIMFSQFLIAGNETTTTHIAATMLLLLERPDLMERCRADLDLIPKLIDESLRLESPVAGLYRTATKDTEIGGVSVPEGSHLLMSYASGNRDDEHFADPDRADLDRDGLGTHLAFGQGPHFCIGSALAKSESRVALTALLTRLDDIRLDPDAEPISYSNSYILRGPKSLPLLFDRA